MSGEHAYFSPSSFAMMMACAGSVQAQARVPEAPPDNDTMEGDAVHWAGETMLKGGLVDVGQIAPNGIVLTVEMLEAADLYVDFVRGRVTLANDPGIVWEVETKLVIKDVHDTLCDGTPDTWFYAPRIRTIEAFDMKFGHRYVDEFENWQLIGYVAGILRKFDQDNMNGLDDQTITVHIHVIQPRCYVGGGSIRTWTVKASDLRGYINRLRNQAYETLKPDVACTPNEHCIDCRARNTCVALQKDGYRSAQISSRSAPLELDATACGLELKFLRDASVRLKARITGLEQQAESMLRDGKTVPYSFMETVVGSAKWTKPVSEVLTLGQLYMKDLSKPDVMTPTQAVKAGIPKEVIEMYSARSSGLKLAADDGRLARKVFGNSS